MNWSDLHWASVLADDQPDDDRHRFAEWVRELSERSGVYLIRADPDRFDDEILYIGESHTIDEPNPTQRQFRGLYRTLTRHFHIGNHWTRGLTYDPRDVVVAVQLVPPDAALEYQDELIAYYRPRDNELVKEMWGYLPDPGLDLDDDDDDDEVPF